LRFGMADYAFGSNPPYNLRRPRALL
jgi:hypothetical protein